MTWNVVKSAVQWMAPKSASSEYYQSSELVDPVKPNLNLGFRTCLYYSSWSIYHNHPPQDIPLQHTTHIFYAFFDLTKTGNVVLSEPWAETTKPFPSLYERNHHYKGIMARFFEIKKNNRHIKTSLSIGGWSNRENFTECMQWPEFVSNIRDTAVEMMLEYGFDGIDLDWEYPSTRLEADMYLELIAKIRCRLRLIEQNMNLPRDTFYLTIASPAFDEKLDLFNIPEMDKWLSFWNMMTYDFAGEWSDVAGYHCNLYKNKEGELCGDDSINYMLAKGVHPSKLVLGMAIYGRSFGNTKGYGYPFKGMGVKAGDDGTINYKKLPLPASREYYDEEAVCAWCYNRETRMFVSYDNVDSIQTKAKYVVKRKLGGGMFWESLGDRVRTPHFSLVHAFVRGIGGCDKLDRRPNSVDVYVGSEYLSSQFPEFSPPPKKQLPPEEENEEDGEAH